MRGKLRKRWKWILSTNDQYQAQVLIIHLFIQPTHSKYLLCGRPTLCAWETVWKPQSDYSPGDYNQVKKTFHSVFLEQCSYINRITIQINDCDKEKNERIFFNIISTLNCNLCIKIHIMITQDIKMVFSEFHYKPSFKTQRSAEISIIIS